MICHWLQAQPVDGDTGEEHWPGGSKGEILRGGLLSWFGMQV
jgi:hypothetical protein